MNHKLPWVINWSESAVFVRGQRLLRNCIIWTYFFIWWQADTKKKWSANSWILVRSSYSIIRIGSSQGWYFPLDALYAHHPLYHTALQIMITLAVKLPRLFQFHTCLRPLYSDDSALFCIQLYQFFCCSKLKSILEEKPWLLSPLSYNVCRLFKGHLCKPTDCSINWNSSPECYGDRN